MARSGKLSPLSAIVWGALIAGVLDIAAVFAFWAVRNVSPGAILRSIASSLLGPAADAGGAAEALIGLTLHFAVSFAFAAAYVIASLRIPSLQARPLLLGPLYGIVAYVIMTFIVVPMSAATFKGPWPPPLENLAASLAIHLFLFGLPIAWFASRMRSPATATAPA